MENQLVQQLRSTPSKNSYYVRRSCSNYKITPITSIWGHDGLEIYSDDSQQDMRHSHRFILLHTYTGWRDPPVYRNHMQWRDTPVMLEYTHRRLTPAHSQKASANVHAVFEFFSVASSQGSSMLFGLATWYNSRCAAPLAADSHRSRRSTGTGLSKNINYYS